jgi:glycosyltransferase involved in cell wall biosynthesis
VEERRVRRRVCFVTTTDMTLRAFLVEQIRATAREHDITLVSAFGDAAFWERAGVPVRVVHVPFSRSIAPVADLRALWRLLVLFRRGRFDLVHSVTPKAGLLAALAGALAGVPLRFHTFTGQVWATRRGVARTLLRAIDRAMARLLTDVLVDSPTQRAFLEANAVLAPGQGVVLGDGSISGVDTNRFRPDEGARSEVRALHRIPAAAVTFLFLGRITADKGVLPLASAFARLHAEHPDVHLLLVGPDEGGLGDAVRGALGQAVEAATFVGYTHAPERYMQAADVLCLPSRREGFGTSLIEAAAVGLPSVATRIYGITDAVEDGRGGLLVPVDDAEALLEAMRTMTVDSARRRAMGAAAQDRARRRFSQGRMTTELQRLYARRLAEIRR